MLHHTWTYQALIHDLLDMKLNKVRILMKDEESMTSYLQEIDLDTSSDQFWANHAGIIFPKVAVDVKQECNEYQTQLENIEKLKENSNIDPLEATKNLSSILNTVPELQEKKKKNGYTY